MGCGAGCLGVSLLTVGLYRTTNDGRLAHPATDFYCKKNKRSVPPQSF